MQLLPVVNKVPVLVCLVWLSSLVASSFSFRTYPLRSSPEDSQTEQTQLAPSLLEQLRWIRSLLTTSHSSTSASKPLAASTFTGSRDASESSDSSAEINARKRIDFGLSGLDTLDHILSTMDRKTKILPSGDKVKDKELYYLMKVNG